MLRWDDVRRLIVQYAAPAVLPQGFNGPGRTMRRYRPDLVDVIDFRCGKYANRIDVSFGCGLRRFVKRNPKPWNCTFNHQVDFPWHDELLEFRESTAEQITALRIFGPLLVAEAERWFSLIPDVATVRETVNHNHQRGPTSLGLFSVPSPKYAEVVQQLETVLANHRQ